MADGRRSFRLGQIVDWYSAAVVPGRDDARKRGAERTPVIEAPRAVIDAEFGVEISLIGVVVVPFVAQRDLAAVPGPAPHSGGEVSVLAACARRPARPA